MHQVPDALSCLVSPRFADEPRPVVKVDDDIPTFDASTTVRDVSDELADHFCTASCDHKAVHVFCSAMRLSGRDRGLMVQQQQTATKRAAADGTALQSVRLSLPPLNELAARGSSDPWWGQKEGPGPGSVCGRDLERQMLYECGEVLR